MSSVRDHHHRHNWQQYRCLRDLCQYGKGYIELMTFTGIVGKGLFNKNFKNKGEKRFILDSDLHRKWLVIITFYVAILLYGLSMFTEHH